MLVTWLLGLCMGLCRVPIISSRTVVLFGFGSKPNFWFLHVVGAAKIPWFAASLCQRVAICSVDNKGL